MYRKVVRIIVVDMFVIIGEVIIYCNFFFFLLFLLWERSKVNKESGVFVVGLFLDKFRGFKNFIIELRMLFFGLYYFRLVVEMIKEEGVIDFDFGFLEVVLLDIVVKICGKNKVVKGIGKIILDVLDFYDFYEMDLKD